jgi:hypothetical protein
MKPHTSDQSFLRIVDSLAQAIGDYELYDSAQKKGGTCQDSACENSHSHLRPLAGEKREEFASQMAVLGAMGLAKACIHLQKSQRKLSETLNNFKLARFARVNG